MAKPLAIDTGSEDLLARVTDGVLSITLNRPTRRNALSRQMLDGLAALFKRAARDSDIRAVLLSGSGGSFCGGADVHKMSERHGGAVLGHQEPGFESSVEHLRCDHSSVIAALFELPKPTVAAISGAVAGGGVGLALACDIRLAARSAFLVTAFAQLGFSGDYGGTWLLTHLVGTARARELYYFSERVDSAEGERLGLFNQVVDDDACLDEALRLAGRLAAGPTVAYRYMKENLNRALSTDFRTALDSEAFAMGRCSQTEDHRRAVEAFVTKTRPNFKGR